VKSTIATRLQSERLQDAYDIAKLFGMHEVSEDIADLIYSKDEDYQELRESIIKGLKK
jgi:hypothetical protein